MLTAGGPPPAANPPGASFPHNPLQYNIIYVQRGMSPAAAEIEGVVSFCVDNNENGRVRAAAATDCEIQKNEAPSYPFWIGQTVYFSFLPHRLLCAATRDVVRRRRNVGRQKMQFPNQLATGQR